MSRCEARWSPPTTRTMTRRAPFTTACSASWPLAVLRAQQVADVIAGVNFARDNGLDLSIRDGGHSAPGFGTNDGGLVIDMSPMRTVRVDPRNKTARADAGATWGDFNHATHAFGLATTGGIISTTGVTGLTLGGGIGYLCAGVRTFDRQPPLRRCGHRGRKVPHRQRTRERGPVLGAARWRRELRRRDIAGIPAARGGPGVRRPDLLQPGRRRRRCSACSTSSSRMRRSSSAVSPLSRSPRPCPSSPKTGTATHSPSPWCIGPVRSTKPKKSFSRSGMSLRSLPTGPGRSPTRR